MTSHLPGEDSERVAPSRSTVGQGSRGSDEQAVLTFHSDAEDATPVVRAALEGVHARAVTLVFEPGRYVFRGERAHACYLAITNHDNGLKRIVFPFERFDSVRIEGNGAEFIFHGQVLPFLFRGCLKVEMRNLTLDWDVPFYFQAKVSEVNSLEGWTDLEPFVEGFSWSIGGGRLRFPEVDGYSYRNVGETLAFDPVHRRVAHGALDLHLGEEEVRLQPDGRLRLHSKLAQFPEPGTVIVSKGKMGENRYAPAIYGIRSSNLHLEGVCMHHALGMGFLFERCEAVTLRECGAYVRPGSTRMVSLLADATHFCNCKGHILVEGCRFQHMLDDGTNVHGTYVVVEEVLKGQRVRVRLAHFQQFGFEFAGQGDEVWCIRAPDPGRASVMTVKAVEGIDEQFSILTFEEAIVGRLHAGDLLENKTWNPSFTLRRCTISDHRARSVVLKTPLPIRIEENHFSSMMSAILFRGESRYWFESGSVSDALIRNNRFDHCAYSVGDHAVFRVSPRLGSQFDRECTFDRMIVIEGNQIRTFGNRIVWAERVQGLQIIENTILQTCDAPVLDADAPTIALEHCHAARIERNCYQGTNPRSLMCDAVSSATLVLKGNPGFMTG